MHDLDFEETESNPKEHGLKTAQLLHGKIAEEVEYAIKRIILKNTAFEPKSELDFALIASDAISGLVISLCLDNASKKLSDVSLDSLIKKFKKGFLQGIVQGKESCFMKSWD